LASTQPSESNAIRGAGFFKNRCIEPSALVETADKSSEAEPFSSPGRVGTLRFAHPTLPTLQGSALTKQPDMTRTSETLYRSSPAKARIAVIEI
jgi:hypothetical protein